MNHPVIKTTGLSYSYSRGTEILTSIDMFVEQGAIYGFLGPNGSGKTTTLSLLLGLIKNQKGTIELFGKTLTSDRSAILKKTGTLIEVPSLYSHLTAKENLEIYRRMYGAPKSAIDDVLKMVDLHYTGKKVVKKFSLGMKQRLSIALSLLGKPELLILDEPANGLDPEGIIDLRNLVKNLNSQYGMTILISSHILAEIEKMVTHVGIIHKGRMLFQGSLQQLNKHQQKDAHALIQTSDNNIALKLLHNYQPDLEDGFLTVTYSDIGQLASINRMLMNNDLDVYLLQPKQNNLEQIFIDLVEKH